MRVRSLTLTLALIAFAAQAEVGPVSAVLNQARMGAWCRDVRGQDLRAAGIDCPDSRAGPLGQSPLLSLRVSAQDMLERAIEDDAARLQIQKNSCLSEQAGFVTGNRAAFRTWSAVAIAAWMGLKRAQLMRSRCVSQYWRSLDPALVGRVGHAQAYEMSVRNLRQRNLAQAGARTAAADADSGADRLREICLSERWAQGLRAAESYFSLMLPVLSSPEIFSAIERNRESLTVRGGDGQILPLTDEALLGMNLNDLSGVQVNGSAISTALTSALSTAARERRGITAEIEATAQPSTGTGPRTYQLDASLRRYVYQDGSVEAALRNRGLLETDEWGAHRRVSPSAGCVLAWRQSSLAGGVLDFASNAALFALGSYRAMTAMPGRTAGIQWAGRASGAVNVGRSAVEPGTALRATTQGALMAQGVDVLSTIQTSCRDRRTDDPRLSDSTGRAAVLRAGRWSLPGEVAYDPVTLNIPAESAPSCPSDGQKLAVDARYRTDCPRDVLLSVAPPQAIPAVLILDSARSR